MKKIRLPLLLLFIIASAVVVWSCKKRFFEASSNDGSITDATAFKTKADFDRAVIGTYASLVCPYISGDLWASIPGYVSQDWVALDLKPKPISIFIETGVSDFGGTLDYWTSLYKIVASANLVLDKLAIAPEGILTDAEKASMIAQAKFLRGWAYFMLARAFGDVPMPLAYNLPEQNSMSCTPSDDVFKQVVSDLTEAAAGLPEYDDWATADKGRATKGAAFAYLANAYMYLKDWANAAKATTDLFALNKPKYALAADVHTPFSILKKHDPEYIKENIFEVEYREKAGDNF